MIRDFNIQNEHVNLLVTIDRKYIEPLVVMLQSYHSTHRHVKTDVYIAHSSLDENDFVCCYQCWSYLAQKKRE